MSLQQLEYKKGEGFPQHGVPTTYLPETESALHEIDEDGLAVRQPPNTTCDEHRYETTVDIDILIALTIAMRATNARDPINNLPG